MAVARIEIIADLLALCSQPKRKEWIEARFNLSEVFFQAYLTICLSQRLLDLKPDESYITTEKGYRFLRTYATFSDIVKSPVLSAH
jgi:predicted transcriptional regulator